MRITAEPRSDQWNADDFVGSPRTFTIADVVPGKAEQKYDIELVEGDDRVWRPPLSMLRLLIAAWGDDATVWKGRRVTLYRDESVRFGKDAVGGIRVSHMSHLPDGKRFSTRLTVSRGKKAPYTVEPLNDDAEANQKPAQPTQQQVQESTNLDQLRAWWQTSGAERRAQIQARVAELEQPQQQEQDDDQAGFNWPPAEEPTDA